MQWKKLIFQEKLPFQEASSAYIALPNKIFKQTKQTKQPNNFNFCSF